MIRFTVYFEVILKQFQGSDFDQGNYTERVENWREGILSPPISRAPRCFVKVSAYILFPTSVLIVASRDDLD